MPAKFSPPKGVSATQFAERIMFTAWQAAGGTTGLGFLQNRPEADEAAVVRNCRTAGDYPGGYLGESKQDVIDGDYVFGRMLKTTVRTHSDGTVSVSPETPRPGYQGWMRRYLTVKDLVEAAAASFER